MMGAWFPTEPVRRRKRRKWKGPNNPTRQARQVWAYLFPGEPWPKGWRVVWTKLRSHHGLCWYGRRLIELSYDHACHPVIDWRAPDEFNGVVATLAHEFVHQRCGHKLRHGAEFKRIERALLGKLGLLCPGAAPLPLPKRKHTTVTEREAAKVAAWKEKRAA